jgi:hypothetical protein
MRANRPRSTSSAGHAILAAALAILASANLVHAAGGDDVRIFRSTGGVQAGEDYCALAFTATGEVFAALYMNTEPEGYKIHRSTDRGATSVGGEESVSRPGSRAALPVAQAGECDQLPAAKRAGDLA